MKFEDAFERLIGREGGYVNHPEDPGGETKFGISKRSYPAEDIRGMTLERAQEIYRRDFWDVIHGDEMPDPLAFNVFDAAVNHGRGNAVRWLQRAADVADDGKIGPITMAAIRAAGPNALAGRFNGERLAFMASLSTWPSFGKGWARRIARNLKEISL